ncbi:MAG: Cupin domain protein [Promethearchaeota archaeon]|nr:MAG: Cupin domain protein [Candidatus Lokiarchaeota archaeon]
MKIVNENDIEYRKGSSGVKYLMRGPSIDWGVIRLLPGEKMADKPHGHESIDETFYFVEGEGIMVINGKDYAASEGSAFLIEPREMHNIRNESSSPIKVVFIKGEYRPDDKIE